MGCSWVKTFLFLPNACSSSVLAALLSIVCGFSALRCNVTENSQFPICDTLVLPEVTNDLLPQRKTNLLIPSCICWFTVACPWSRGFRFCSASAPQLFAIDFPLLSFAFGYSLPIALQLVVFPFIILCSLNQAGSWLPLLGRAIHCQATRQPLQLHVVEHVELGGKSREFLEMMGPVAVSLDGEGHS